MQKLSEIIIFVTSRKRLSENKIRLWKNKNLYGGAINTNKEGIKNPLPYY